MIQIQYTIHTDSFWSLFSQQSNTVYCFYFLRTSAVFVSFHLHYFEMWPFGASEENVNILCSPIDHEEITMVCVCVVYRLRIILYLVQTLNKFQCTHAHTHTFQKMFISKFEWRNWIDFFERLREMKTTGARLNVKQSDAVVIIDWSKNCSRDQTRYLLNLMQ